MDGLQVKFQKQLKNFPLCIQFEAEGGCVGILGASGCGKSMTLKTIAGIETPDTGRICLGGRELFHRERNSRSAVQKTKRWISISELRAVSQYDSSAEY